MTEPPNRGSFPPREPIRPSVNKPGRRFSELTRRVQAILGSGWVRWLVVRKWPLALLIAMTTAVLVSPHIGLPSSSYKVGDYTNKAIKARRDIVIKDEEATGRRRTEAASKVWPVYDYAPGIRKEEAKKVDTAFEEARELFRKSGSEEAAAQILSKSDVNAVKSKFQKTLGIVLSEKDLSLLVQLEFRKSLQDLTRHYVEKALGQIIVGNRKFLLDEIASEEGVKLRGLTVRNLDEGKEYPLSTLDEIYETNDVFALLEEDARKRDQTTAGALALKIAQLMIQPNLTFNKSETEERKRNTKDQVALSVISFKKNQIIVGEGVLVTQEIIDTLEALQRHHRSGESLILFFGIFLFSFLLLTAVYYFAEMNLLRFRLSQRDILFLSSFLAISLILVALCMVIIDAISDQFESLTPGILLLAIPLASAAMTVRFLTNIEIALAFSIVISFLSALVADPTLTTVIYFLAGSLMGAHFIRKANQRNTIVTAGLYTGLFNIAAIVALRLALDTGNEVITLGLGFSGLFAFLGGIFSGLVVLAITPVIEWAFGYTSNTKLLELASLNHPLLKEMVVRAPGTYNHSTLVSSLAEGAGEAIGCNAMLCKVAGLYHDIGKINKPEYFYENLRNDADNKHNTLFPRMSGLILTSHVKEGVELATRHNLGDPIADIIQQHHGTSLIYYFYKRAKEQEDPSMSPVEESDYRYQGPRPQSREAAIVMMADIAEASTRSLPNPTPARIGQNVEEMIQRAFTDGQLDECNLTFRDLDKIGKTFTMILTGVFHARIQYPEPEEKETKTVDDRADSKPTNPSESERHRAAHHDRKDF